MIDVDAYLRRIGYRGPTEPDPGALRDLHRAHLYTVPFENLDIHRGRPIVLTEDALVHKVVTERRGGFCYELNGAFAALLRALDFEVSMLAAGVAMGEGGFGPVFDHMALAVSTPGDPARWLVDVGFGEGFLDPLPFEVGQMQNQGNGDYLIDQEGDGDELILSRRPSGAGSFGPQYRFADRAYDLVDYAGMCTYHQTSPRSHFTQARVCSLTTPDGRISLAEDRLIVTRGGERTDWPIADDAEYRAALRDHFGIVLDGDPRMS